MGTDNEEESEEFVLECYGRFDQDPGPLKLAWKSCERPGYGLEGSRNRVTSLLPPCYPQKREPHCRSSYYFDSINEPWRNRTSNLLIKSQLLCQLS